MKKFVVVIFIALLSGCLKQKISTKKTFEKVNHLNQYSADFYEEKNGIALAMSKYSQQDCRHMFGVNVINCGFQPMQITIKNMSKGTVILNPTGLQLDLVSPKTVAKRCHWKTKEITGGAGILSCIFFWPAIIPTAYYGYQMYDTNRQISKRLLIEEIVNCWDLVKIRTLEIVSRIVFVHKNDVPETIHVDLFSKEKNDYITFNVTL